MVRLAELRKQAERKLKSCEIENAAFDADLMIEKSSGIPYNEFELKQGSSVDETAVFELVDRRCGGEPLQYILGEWEFWGLPFRVGKGVLIPRPDTEVLVEQSLRLIKGISNPKVLDLCSGSGCIATAIAHERADADVTAVELYDAAFGYLEENVKLNGVKVNCVRCDVLGGPNERLASQRFDLIVSNPPYIDSTDMSSLQREVKHEPATALAGGNDGLLFYRAIAEKWTPLMSKCGYVAAEIGWNQAADVITIFSQKNLRCSSYKDYGGNDRVIIGTL